MVHLSDSRSTNEVSSSRILLLVSAVAACVTLLITQAGSLRESLEYRCLLAADYSVVAHVDNPVLSAEATMVPIGRRCVWLGQDGVNVVGQTGWVPTIVAFALTIFILAMSILPGPRKVRILALSASFICCSIWAIVLYVASK